MYILFIDHHGCLRNYVTLDELVQNWLHLNRFRYSGEEYAVRYFHGTATELDKKLQQMTEKPWERQP